LQHFKNRYAHPVPVNWDYVRSYMPKARQSTRRLQFGGQGGRDALGQGVVDRAGRHAGAAASI